MVSALGGGPKKDAPNYDQQIDNAETRLKASGRKVSALSQSYGDTGNQSFKDQVLSKLSPLMDTADSVLNVVERPSQAILHGLQAFSGSKGHITGNTLSEAGKGFLKGLTDVSGQDNLNLRATLNQDPNAGGRLAGLFDTVGTAAIDPTSYLTIGTKAVGKSGLKVIESQLGKETAQQVDRHGFSSLSPKMQTAVRDALQSSSPGAATKGGAEQFTQDAVRALEDGNGLKLAGKTILKGETLRPLTEAAHIPQAVEAFNGTKLADTLRGAFGTLPTRLAPSVGKDAASVAETVIRQGRAGANNAIVDAGTQLREALKRGEPVPDGALPKTAARLFDQSGAKADHEVVDKELIAKLSARKDIETINVAHIRETTKQSIEAEQARIAAQLHKYELGAESTRAKVKALELAARSLRVGTEKAKGVLDSHDSSQAVPNNVLKGIRATGQQSALVQGMLKIARQNAQIADHKLGILNSQADNVKRKSVENLRQQAADAIAEERALTDQIRQQINNVKSSLKPVTEVQDAFERISKSYKNQATNDIVKGLEAIKAEDGTSLIVRDETKVPEGYEALSTPDGKVFAPKEIVSELKSAELVINSDEAKKRLEHIVDEWGKLWRGYATVPTLFGLGFHERNLVGNVFNMWLRGFHNPALFKTSDKIFRAIESGTNAGLPIDKAIARAKSLTPQERNWLQAARKEGVIGDSFFRTDQASTPTFGRNTKEKIGAAINPISPDNVVLRSGSYVGRRIEDNSRLSMFIDQMQKHGDPTIAAQEVKKALFDYSELTGTERSIKRLVPFYTYMRKNTPLQLESLATNPGKFSALAHARDNLQASAADTDGKPLPQYALAQGAIPLLGGDTPVLGSFSLPFQAAFQQIQPLLELASQAPGTPNSLKTEGGTSKAIRDMLGNFGGGPVELGKAAVEQATGKSLLTGGDLQPGTGDERLLKALLPLYGKGDTTIKDLSSGDEGQLKARLLAALAGLSAIPVTDRAVNGEEARRAKELQSEAKGTASIADLRKQGKAPKAKSKTVTTKSKKGTLPKKTLPKSTLPKKKS